ncbi:response regulator [Paenibacillus dokdonensis]|uniref:Response regulator n=1 Tax=Paenibacillus dokdonensis TaxID=2567944 RepID=A0ABU6GPX6_9BACL|nr:response regulator [Paenibacillus dokdonensis]MEC0241755.1 response regulator [Paenibacillus dokdonensis]
MYELLIVDDHAHLVDSLERNMPWETLGIGKVHKAFSGEEALEYCKSYPVDIVITDIRMPGISGLELIEHIKKYDKHFKSILLSGYGEWDYAQEAIRQQVDGYLLKPVDHGELACMLQRLTEDLQLEWDERGKQEKAMRLLHEHMPLLREKLLMDLLQGRKLSTELLEEKLAYYQMPFRPSDETAMCVLRIESSAEELNWQDQSLLASAVVNIAEETFSDLFYVWRGRDPFEHEIFILKAREASWLEREPQPERARQQSFEHLASRLQRHVRHFLKSSISIVVSHWHVMAHGLRGTYQDSLAVFARHLGGETDLFIGLQDAVAPDLPYRIHSLYESPPLIQLFEIGQWEAISAKWDAIFQEVTDKRMESRETLLELYYHAMGAFSFFAHKNGLSLHDIIPAESDKAGDASRFRHMRQLQDWVLHTLDRLREMTKSEWNNEQAVLIRKVRQFITDRIADATLQTAADHVSLHPAYLSSLFKNKTRENISEYMYKMRMQQAREMLIEQPELKVSDVASAIGYHKPQYFIKLFKEHYGLTPQDFRHQYS